MSTNIEGLLRNMKGKKITILTDDNGKKMSDKQARAAIAELQAKGHKLIPCGDCEGFDPFGGGCPGHTISDEIEIT
jgi:tRNA G37 N-methylase TrmD